MKRSMLSLALLACLVVALLIVTAFAAVSSASAQLGNTGVPVICQSTSLLSGESADMTCQAADGTFFDSAKFVPAGHYLFVTDYLVLSGTAAGRYSGEVCSVEGSTLVICLPAYGDPNYPASKHFTTPMLWAKSGQFLRASNTSTLSAMSFRISGLLTTNASYLPLTSR